MSTRQCPKCGHEQNENLALCKKCRTDLDALLGDNTGPVKMDQHSKDRPWWGTLGAIMSGIQCVGSLFLVFYYLTYESAINIPAVVITACVIGLLTAALTWAITANLWSGRRKYNSLYIVITGLLFVMSLFTLSVLSILATGIIFVALLNTSNHPFYNQS